MGRPSKLTPETQARICELLRQGVPRERSARLCGISEGTFHNWTKQGRLDEAGEKDSKYREFLKEVCKAEDYLVNRAISRVTGLLGDDIDDRVALNAAKFILSHRYNREFSTRQEVTGPAGGPVEVQARVEVKPLFSDEQMASMTPDQIRAALEGLE